MIALLFWHRLKALTTLGTTALCFMGSCRAEEESPSWDIRDETVERDLVLLPGDGEIPYVNNRFHLFRLAADNIVYVWYWDGEDWQKEAKPVLIPEGWYIGPEICPIEVVIPTHDDLLATQR